VSGLHEAERSNGAHPAEDPTTPPFDRPEFVAVWDRVLADARIAAHISEQKDPAISNADLVAAFHKAATELSVIILPEQVCAALGRYDTFHTFAHPDGTSAMNGVFLKDLRELWAEKDAALVGGCPGLAEQLSAGRWLVREVPSVEKLLGDLITAGTRCFIIGRTGLGKTLFGLAMAMGMAFGTGFLHWRSSRPVRVLYLDGEMPIDLLVERARDEARRTGRTDLLDNLMLFSAEDAEAIAEQYPMLGMLEPLNTEAGLEFIKRLCAALKPDVIIFDNVQALLVGSQKEEETWTATLPLVQWLSKQRIAQVWIDHTGHNTDRQYGSNVKQWRFDVAAQMADATDDVPREPHDTVFVLSFPKARRRKPSNWEEFTPHIIRLREDQWSSEPVEKREAGHGPGNVPPSRRVFYDALVVAAGRLGDGWQVPMSGWEAEAQRRGLIEKPEPKETRSQRAARYRDFRRAKSDLLGARWIAIEGDMVIDLKGRSR
jgi:hypothetical protein